MHKIAILKNITDNPDARKLQKVPVPCLGGVAVFFGIIMALLIAGVEFEASKMFTIVCAFTLMLYIGTMDDILSLSPLFRLFMEVLILSLLIYGGSGYIDDFHGLWGIYSIPDWIAVPLTIFACVGIINAINLIDGVNGLCSGYCIMACIAFGVVAIWSGDQKSASFATIFTGALIPFFLHNVFGKKSKMFLGDGGSLLMGTIIAYFIISMLKSDSQLSFVANGNFGFIPFVLAVLAIPVFDTLRVMTSRMLRGTSPFSPDKTHLHHMLFRLHFSHIGTTLTEILSNMLIFVVWFACWHLGASVEVQLYAVVSLGFLATFGFYWYGMSLEKHQGRGWRILTRIGDRTHVGHTKWFGRCTRLLDRKY
ncbi:MAG: undecaprenyl/decaprenyl-phosphate alpha-N-acetylglucosaminyl 1-phosphate transferase [Alistipes sp.]|nr:undecaprenyl/decaprenyl-phosphate alpha-N-acetylglucosaminyl 1-phosphate transferase [Alistipes sp.]